MPIYEARIVIREAVTQWRFPASDIEEAKMRLQEEVDDLIDDVVTAMVVKVEKP